MKFSKNISKLKDNKYIALLPDFKKEKAQKISSIVFSLVALSFFGFFAIEPTLSTIAKLKKELSDSMYVNEKLLEKISNLSSLQRDYNLLENDIPIVLSAVPLDPQLPSLMGQVQSLARQNNIAISNLQSYEVEAANSKNTEKEFYSFSFVTTGSGSYTDIINFLSALTSMQRVITIDEILISKGGLSDSLQFNMKGTAYFKY
ncbi:MAG: type 4a pilus biogenesis protein PilO [Patescibacteria group bacterium]